MVIIGLVPNPTNQRPSNRSALFLRVRLRLKVDQILYLFIVTYRVTSKGETRFGLSRVLVVLGTAYLTPYGFDPFCVCAKKLDPRHQKSSVVRVMLSKLSFTASFFRIIARRSEGSIIVSLPAANSPIKSFRHSIATGRATHLTACASHQFL